MGSHWVLAGGAALRALVSALMSAGMAEMKPTSLRLVLTLTPKSHSTCSAASGGMKLQILQPCASARVP